jgi:hypothetical protein
MRKRVKLGRPSHATIVSYIALFVALGGSAYAAGHLGKNSVGTKQLKKNSVTNAKIKKGAVTGAKVESHSLTGENIELSSLGTVPRASLADSANALAATEPTHRVGSPGEPPFQGGSGNTGPNASFKLQPVGFYKDHEGIVHLEGYATVGAVGPLAGVIFTLPPGYRPQSGTELLFEQVSEAAAVIFGSNTTHEGVIFDGFVLGTPGKHAVLDGITFRAES